MTDRILQIKWYYSEYLYKVRTKDSLNYSIDITIKNLLIDMRYSYGSINT